MSKLTTGEHRIRTKFNVSEDPKTYKEVDTCKQNFANLINWCENHKHKDPRLAAEAMTRIEDASHWMVKLINS